MANFDAALKRVLAYEVRYSNHPADRGGETYCGITRRFEAEWVGWERLEAMRNQPDFPECLARDLVLMGDVREIYRAKYWLPIVGEGILDQEIAEEVFEAGVNVGVAQAVKWLQRALNALNRNLVLWPDLIEDGLIGGNTLMAIRRAVTSGRAGAVVKLQNAQQAMYYLEIMRRDPGQEVFALGWLSRT